MKGIAIFFFVFFIGFSIELYGQSSVLLRGKHKASKTRKLSLDRINTIITDRAEFYHTRVVGVTDTSLLILNRVKTGDSTMRITKFINEKANDTTYHAEFRDDTLGLPFMQIVSLKRNLLKNTGWAEPFLWFSFAGVGALALAPIVAIAEGPEVGLQCLKAGGIFLGITLPVIFVASRTVSYDVKNKWTFSK